jgi:hypothetical protein
MFGLELLQLPIEVVIIRVSKFRPSDHQLAAWLDFDPLNLHSSRSGRFERTSYMGLAKMTNERNAACVWEVCHGANAFFWSRCYMQRALGFASVLHL